MSSEITADSEAMYGSCGIGVWSDFFAEYYPDVTKRPSPGGAGWHLLMFVEGRSSSKNMYEYAKSRWSILYQSEVRVNKNSGNKVFFCIYDTSNDPLGFGWDDYDKTRD